MSESMWGYLFLVIGILAAALLILFGNINTKNEQNYYSLKEVVQNAMLDSFDKEAYDKGLTHSQVINSSTINCAEGIIGTIRINKDEFVENFARRYAQVANINTNYTIKIFDIQECPAKVSVSIESKENYSWVRKLFRGSGDDEVVIVNDLSAILETKD